jgi:hypothetical protein
MTTVIDAPTTMLTREQMLEFLARTVSRALSLADVTDPRSLAVVDALRSDSVTGDVLADADAGAYSASWSAYAAARFAAYSAAYAAAWAARSADTYAADAAVYAADAAVYAADAASRAAYTYAAARDAERGRQIDDLLELIG